MNINRYLTRILWSDDDEAYIAEVPALPGCVAHGATMQEAAQEISVAMRLWLDDARKHGDPIPEPECLLHNEPVRGTSVTITADYLTVELKDGRVISTPLMWYPRLESATPEDRSVWEWIGDGSGIHWPLIDEDLSIKGMLEGVASIEYRK